jgi:DNA-binding NarL/FixJ family response regulator
MKFWELSIKNNHFGGETSPAAIDLEDRSVKLIGPSWKSISLIGEGCTTTESANLLSSKTQTAKSRIQNILEKQQRHNSSVAKQYAHERNLLNSSNGIWDFPSQVLVLSIDPF